MAAAEKKRRRQEIFYGHDRNPKEECRKYFVTAFHKFLDISDMDNFFDYLIWITICFGIAH